MCQSTSTYCFPLVNGSNHQQLRLFDCKSLHLSHLPTVSLWATLATYRATKGHKSLGERGKEQGYGIGERERERKSDKSCHRLCPSLTRAFCPRHVLIILNICYYYFCVRYKLYFSPLLFMTDQRMLLLLCAIYQD